VSVERQHLLDAFEARAGVALRTSGFEGRNGHYVRRAGDVTQVIELQVSIYGARVTANLGIDLPWLEPALRWIHPPDIGPHAHESIRWIRIGVATPEGRDRWWSFAEPVDLDVAVRELGAEILGPGLAWLDRESGPAALLKEAEARVDRSKGPRHPHGRFAELRLLAAVLAWNRRLDEARAVAEQASTCWEEERQKLSNALASYRSRFATSGTSALAVPDLAQELEALISPTTGAFGPAQGDRSSSPSGQ
jgi:hypothetical protein